MTTYYVNPDIGNDANDGTANDADHAWATLDFALDLDSAVAAGDTVLCVHGTGNDETPSGEIVVEVAGDKTSGWINVIGVNSSAVDDGTRYIIDGGSLSAGLSLLYISSTTGVYIYFKNIEFNHAKDEAVEFAGSYPKFMIFDNCILHGSTNEAVGNYGQHTIWYKCQFTGNGADGVYRPWNSIFLFCVFSGNTGDGVQDYHGNIYYGCISHANGGHGLYTESGNQTLFFVSNNIFDGNTGDGVQRDSSATPPFLVLLGNRITNNAKGLDEDDDDILCTEIYNFFLNNSTTDKEGTLTPLSGTGSLSAGTEGYTDRANHDFNLTSSATLRRTAINLGSF